MGWAAVESLLAEIYDSGAAPGVALACWHRGAKVFSGFSGRLGSDAGDPPVREGTVFDLASLTKALCTAPLVWKRFESGEWAKADTLGKFFPDLKAEAQGQITLAQLLSHTSGYPAVVHLDQMGANGPESAYHLVKFLPLESKPGTVCRYSDVGYLVLGHLLEREAGMSLDRLYETEINRFINGAGPGFRPNGVGRSAPDGIALTSIPDGYLRPLNGVVEDENTRLLGGVSGASGLFGNVEQVGAVARELRSCWIGTGELLGRTLLEKVWSVIPSLPGCTWTLGWDTPSDTNSTAGSYFSLESVGHLGFVGTSIWYDRMNDVIVVLLSNRVNPSRANMCFNSYRPKIHDAIMKALGIIEVRPRRYS